MKIGCRHTSVTWNVNVVISNKKQVLPSFQWYKTECRQTVVISSHDRWLSGGSFHLSSHATIASITRIH